MHGVPAADRAPRVNEMAALLGFTTLLDNYPRQLSGGQQQRAALGRALIRHPKLFLMDEPLSNLDTKLLLRMRTEIGRLHREVPVTTMYVTHDQSEAMALSDRVVVMNQGAVSQLDTPERIYDRPANLFVAGLVGSPVMNLLPVSLVPSDIVVRCIMESRFAVASVKPCSAIDPGHGILGMRPKHVEWQPLAAGAEGPWLPGIVQETDDTGDDTLIYADVGKQSIRVLERHGRSVRAGDKIGIRFPAELVHLFVDGGRVDLDSTSALAKIEWSSAVARAGSACPRHALP